MFFFSSSASSRVQYGVRVVNDVNVQVSRGSAPVPSSRAPRDDDLGDEGKASQTDSRRELRERINPSRVARVIRVGVSIVRLSRSVPARCVPTYAPGTRV